jgi:signal transduction histidine kinase
VGVSVEVDADGLDRELEVVLLRCTQEALANVRKHARAARVRVTVAADSAAVTLEVSDDGVGPGEAVPGRGGFGLAGMRDRVALVGGRLAFGPGSTGGTVLRVTVPRADDAESVTSADPNSTEASP